MKTRSFLTLFALLLCLGLSAQATERAKNRAKNRAESRANTKVDQKVDRAVDDAFNAIGGLFKKKKEEAPAGAEAGNPASPNGQVPAQGSAGGGSWEPYTNPHTFSVRMEITQVKKNGKREEVAMDMVVTSNRFCVRMEDEAAQEVSRMILNTEDGKTTMITTDNQGRQSGYRMRMPGMRQAMTEVTEDIASDRFTFTRTGERKVIDGYNCEKLIVEDKQEGITTESWVTQDIKMNAQDIFSGMMGMFGAGPSKQKNSPANAFAGGYEGFPIMSISTDGKETFETHFKNMKFGEAEVDRSLLQTNGIQIQELGF